MIQLYNHRMICYICVREFGSQTISIHEPHCQRSGIVQIISYQDVSKDQSPGDLGSFRVVPLVLQLKIRRLHHSAEAQLLPCGNCGWTFLSDCLILHQRSCKEMSAAAQSVTTK
uniref:Uncharacterized protein n=1 Tax=Pavo cristatus TaxID=9049 RepID=A0A8C9EPA1_PAVCR